MTIRHKFSFKRFLTDDVPVAALWQISAFHFEPISLAASTLALVQSWAILVSKFWARLFGTNTIFFSVLGFLNIWGPYYLILIILCRVVGPFVSAFYYLLWFVLDFPVGCNFLSLLNRCVDRWFYCSLFIWHGYVWQYYSVMHRSSRLSSEILCIRLSTSILPWVSRCLPFHRSQCALHRNGAHMQQIVSSKNLCNSPLCFFKLAETKVLLLLAFKYWRKEFLCFSIF